jgi:hypothetical protein
MLDRGHSQRREVDDPYFVMPFSQTSGTLLAAVTRRGLAVLAAKRASKRGLTTEASTHGDTLHAELAVEQVDSRSPQTQTTDRVVHRLSQKRPVDAVKVIRRKVSQSCERLELEPLVQVFGQVFDDTLDALCVPTRVLGHVA